MMCLCFFLSVYTISSRNNISIFNFDIFSGGKVNLVGALISRSKFKIPSSFNFSKLYGKTKKGPVVEWAGTNVLTCAISGSIVR